MDARTVKYWGGGLMRALQLIAKGTVGKPTRLKGLPAFASGGPVTVDESLVRQIDQRAKRAGGGEALEKIQVEIVEGKRSYTGEFPKEDQEDLLDMLSRLQARA
jgi:hypothetical protein